MEVCLWNTMTKRWIHLWNKCTALHYLTVFSMYMIFYVWKLYREQLHICLSVLINNEAELFIEDVASHEFTQVRPSVTQFFKVSEATLQFQFWYKIFMGLAAGKGLRILQLEIICPTIVKHRTLEQILSWPSCCMVRNKQVYSSVKLISGQHSIFIGKKINFV